MYYRWTSLDLAIDPGSCKHKGAIDRKIQVTQMLSFSHIHAGNLVYKAVVRVEGVKMDVILTKGSMYLNKLRYI